MIPRWRIIHELITRAAWWGIIPWRWADWLIGNDKM